MLVRDYAGLRGGLVLCRRVQRLVERRELFHIDFSKRKYGNAGRDRSHRHQ